MSMFGDYVHLTWRGYREHGTHRASSKANNYSGAKRFTAHATMIDKLYLSRLEVPNLQQLEDEYNTRVQNQYSLLKSLADNNRGYFESLIAVLIPEINSKWNTPAMIAELASHIQVNESTQMLEYIPDTNSIIYQYNKGSSQLPKLNWSTNSASGRYMGPISKYALNLADKLKELYPDSSEQDQKILKDLSKEINTFDKTFKPAPSDKLVEGAPKRQAQSFKDQAEQFKQQIDNIRLKYSSIEEINRQLTAAFAEMFGNMAAYHADTYAKNQLAEAMKQALKVGARQTQKGRTPDIAPLSFKEAAIEFDEKGATSSIFKKIETGTFTAEGQEKVQYEFKNLGDPKQQKADIEITLSGQKYGISMKNTDLSKVYFKDANGKIRESTINIQDSSLLLYLLGIEQKTPMLGTQYLNVLAEHSSRHDDDTEYYATRQAANKALTMYIIYSALTGQGQLRQGGNANILAIQDKNNKLPSGINRVRFFDMAKIVRDMTATTDNDVYKTIAKINLKNDYVDGEYSEAIPKRLTRLLMDARNETIAVALKTSLLI